LLPLVKKKKKKGESKEAQSSLLLACFSSSLIMEEILSREGIKEQPHTQRGAGLLLFFFVSTHTRLLKIFVNWVLKNPLFLV
jgi:hypothetical protein